MARDPRQAAPPAALGPRVRRLLADNQRLIAFPVLAEAFAVLAFLPLLLSLGGVDTFSDYALAEANDAGTSRVLEDGTDVGTTSMAAFAAAVVLSALGSAWAMAGFLRSFDRPVVVIRPDGLLVLRLFVLYLAVRVIQLAALFVSAGLALPVFLLLLVPTLYADLAIAFDGGTVADGLRSSVRFWRRYYLRSTVAVLVLILATLLMDDVFVGAMEGAERVFPPVLLAMILASGLLGYVANCVLIGFFADRDGLAEAA